MRKFPLYIIDRAGQFTTQEFPSYEEQCAAADRWEAGGHETYFNYIRKFFFAFVNLMTLTWIESNPNRFFTKRKRSIWYCIRFHLMILYCSLDKAAASCLPI